MAVNDFSLPSPTLLRDLNQLQVASQVPGVISDSRVKTPMLVILLGSTPALVAVELQQHMLTLSPADRRKAAFVFIDTDDLPAELVMFRKTHRGLFQEFTERISVPAHPEAATWPAHQITLHTRIPPKMPQFFAAGAGGMRNNGHVALAFNQERVRLALEQALNSLGLIEVRGAARIDDVQVNIIPFLGGGTGSGIAADIAVMVRQILIQRQLHHRLNIFCMLPEQLEGVPGDDVSWRQSNAVACLLEILAHSAAAKLQPDGMYRKYLLNTMYEVTSDALANEIYLIARTGMRRPDGVARIVALDLFQRLCDASGVGLLEQSKWVDRRRLGKWESMTPTPFGMSCVLEIVFDAQATAHAFALRSAAYLLSSLVGAKPSRPDTSGFVSAWDKELDDIADFLAPEGAAYGVRYSQDIPESEFEYAYSDDLDRNWKLAQERCRRTKEAIAQVVARAEQDELARINRTNPPDIVEDRELTTVARHLRELYRLEDKYVEWQKRLDQQARPGVIERPNDLEAKYSNPMLFDRVPLPQPAKTTMRKAAVRDLTNFYYRGMRDTDDANRHVALTTMTARLLIAARKRIDDETAWFTQDRMDQQSQQLIRLSQNSPAWRGKLDRDHPHQRHIFDLPRLRTPDEERNVAVEQLYQWATLGAGEMNNLVQSQAITFHEAVTRLFRNKCTDYLRKQSGDKQDAAALDAQGHDMLTQRVIEFFEDYYLLNIRQSVSQQSRGGEGLLHFNLIELLEYATGESSRKVLASYLHAHLETMRSLIRSLIEFSPALQGDGEDQVNTSLYLAMRWDTQSERDILEKAKDDLGPLTNDLSPTVVNLIDPHRLQVAYGQHGINISTIAEFHHPNNSMMGHYLKHEARWFGRRTGEDARFLSNPIPGLYGANEMPVHNSAEMERLVCSQRAMGWQPSGRPGPNGHEDLSLRGRVIRDPDTHGFVPQGFDDPPQMRQNNQPPQYPPQSRPNYSPPGGPQYPHPGGPNNPPPQGGPGYAPDDWMNDGGIHPLRPS